MFYIIYHQILTSIAYLTNYGNRFLVFEIILYLILNFQVLVMENKICKYFNHNIIDNLFVF